MKRLDRILLLGLAGALLYANTVQLSDTVQQLQDDVLRLHILANSDSEEDQALKLAVRDRLLAAGETLFGDGKDPAALAEAARSSLDQVEAIAADVVAEWGFAYPVHAEFVEMPFDERVYETLTMPAGVYEALRVTIGEAAGHNWWCVMYPPLCIPAAEEVSADPETAEAYFSDAEYDLLTNPQRYRARFKCVEWYHSLRDTLFGKAETQEESTAESETE